MMQVSIKHRKNGDVAIKIGRTTHILKTDGEAEAFIAGAKVAHIELANKIAPILKIKDGRYE